MNIQNRTLFFGDNLKILEEKIPEEMFDLIYLDPPFNSNRDYNVLFKEAQIDSTAQIRAFEDTWEWTESTVKLLKTIEDYSLPKLTILINSLKEAIGPSLMMAYLVNMASRLVPLHRVLKQTGTIYLHCDPTASHYLKILMDSIFGEKNFRNEIIWCYRGGGVPKNDFAKRHDVILRYSKSDNYSFNVDPIRIPYSGESLERLRYKAKSFRGDKIYDEYEPNKLGKHPEDWWELQPIMPSSKERLGYPTQKPEKLLEIIVKGSSNKEDWILDPFCGCGTTVAVAEKFGRNWVGIDVSMQAVNVIKERIKAHYGGIKVNIDGIPEDYESAVALAEKDKFAFQDWGITLVDANPPSGESKKGADRGIDGIILFYEKTDFINPKLRKIVVQVKGGGTNRGDIAKLKGDIERENAPMGVLVTLQEPTSEMKRETALAGEYQYSQTTSFPKIQILSIKDYFEGKSIKLPTDTVNPFKRALPKADQKSLFE